MAERVHARHDRLHPDKRRRRARRLSSRSSTGTGTWSGSTSSMTRPMFSTIRSPRAPGPPAMCSSSAGSIKANAECIAMGRNPATIGRGMWPDYAIEVNRTKQIVWEFHVWDNLVQNFDPTKPNYGQPIDNPDQVGHQLDRSRHGRRRIGYGRVRRPRTGRTGTRPTTIPRIPTRSSSTRAIWANPTSSTRPPKSSSGGSAIPACTARAGPRHSWMTATSSSGAPIMPISSRRGIPAQGTC